MTGRYLLDTNIVIALFANDPDLITHLTTATEVFTASIVLGELYYGALHSHQREANMARVAAFANQNRVLMCDAITAHWYGQVKMGLKAKGKPIPENDIWIAALALQYQLVVVTRDAHFNEIDQLLLARW